MAAVRILLRLKFTKRVPIKFIKVFRNTTKCSALTTEVPSTLFSSVVRTGCQNNFVSNIYDEGAVFIILWCSADTREVSEHAHLWSEAVVRTVLRCGYTTGAAFVRTLCVGLLSSEHVCSSLRAGKLRTFPWSV